MSILKESNAEIIEQQAIDAREYLALWTVAGHNVTIVKPLISEELLVKMRGMARDIMDAERPSPSVAKE